MNRAELHAVTLRLLHCHNRCPPSLSLLIDFPSSSPSSILRLQGVNEGNRRGGLEPRAFFRALMEGVLQGLKEPNIAE